MELMDKLQEIVQAEGNWKPIKAQGSNDPQKLDTNSNNFRGS
jgi:hypothetical protein